MKKHGKMILPNILLVLSLLLSGCGENAEEQKETTRGGEDEKPQTSFTEKGEQWEQNTVKETDGDNPSGEKSEQPEESAEEVDLPPDESLFEYYDLLNAEYEKYGITSPADYIRYDNYDYEFYYTLGKNIIYFENPYDSEKSGSYNIVTKERKTYIGGSNLERATFWSHNWCGDTRYDFFCGNGEPRLYIRTMSDKGEYKDAICVTFKGDEQWDKIKYGGDAEDKLVYSQPDGTLFLTVISNYDGDSHKAQYMISPDYKALTELPNPEVEAEHGIKETKSFRIIGCWNNRVYALADDIGFCCLNTDTLTWEIPDTVGHFGGVIKSVGRYLLSGCTVFDMETNEVVVHNDNFAKNCGSFARTYRGGKYNVINKDGNWYFCRCASDGSDVDFKYYESHSLGEQRSGRCFPISDEYYIYMDEYGYFLRRYETGADWEETIFLIDEAKTFWEEDS